MTVIIPELVVHRWWQQLLHNQTALWLKVRLLFREGTVVTSVPSHVLEEGKIKGPVPFDPGSRPAGLALADLTVPSPIVAARRARPCS